MVLIQVFDVVQQFSVGRVAAAIGAGIMVGSIARSNQSPRLCYSSNTLRIYMLGFLMSIVGTYQVAVESNICEALPTWASAIVLGGLGVGVYYFNKRLVEQDRVEDVYHRKIISILDEHDREQEHQREAVNK